MFKGYGYNTTPHNNITRDLKRKKGFTDLSEFIQINNFLSDKELNQLFHLINDKKEFFRNSETYEFADEIKENDSRVSQVLKTRFIPEYEGVFAKKIYKLLPKVCQKFKMDIFKPSRIEIEINAYQNGGRFLAHYDKVMTNVSKNREISYVYYFYNKPKAFTGGELLIYETEIIDNFFLCYEEPLKQKKITPKYNSLVLFRSGALHEVLPVKIEDNKFENSRFTINGWVHR